LRTLKPCQAMIPLISQSQERRLNPLERLKLRLHLWVCVWCARYLKQIELLRLVLRDRAADGSPASSLPVEARARIYKALQENL
jgi:hypothetical protein